MTQAINPERLHQRLTYFSTIGADPAGGISRPFGSAADLKARQALRQEFEAASLTYRVDAAGNQWGILPGTDPQSKLIVAGSHLDTVPHGGAYDGIGGILISLEAIQTLMQSDYRNRHPLAVVAFTGEEPNPFGLSTLGSRLYTGRLKAQDLLQTVSSSGERLQDALRRVGGDLTHCQALDPTEVALYIEPHVEQSGRLDEADLPIGVVDCITGIYRDHITLIGEQNHAGTTPLGHRKDALEAFAEAALIVEELLQETWPEWMVGTIGQVSVYPNAINIVPSRVDFIVEWRSTDQSQLHRCAERYRDTINSRMHTRHVTLSATNVLDQAPQTLSVPLRQFLQQQVEQHQHTHLTLSSWAGHDATHMARVVPTGMLFIRSIGGKSHCPDEFSRSDDLALAASILCDSLKQLDQVVEEVISDAASL